MATLNDYPKIQPPRRPPAHRLYMHTFVAWSDGTFSCSDCIPLDCDIGDDDVQIWEEDSEGWTAPPVCCGCKRSIPVYVNAQEIANA